MKGQVRRHGRMRVLPRDGLLVRLFAEPARNRRQLLGAPPRPATDARDASLPIRHSMLSRLHAGWHGVRTGRPSVSPRIAGSHCEVCTTPELGGADNVSSVVCLQSSAIRAGPFWPLAETQQHIPFLAHSQHAICAAVTKLFERLLTASIVDPRASRPAEGIGLARPTSAGRTLRGGCYI